MTKLILSALSAVALLVSGASFAATGVGGAVTKYGYALDLSMDQGPDAFIHGQLGAYDRAHELFENDNSHQVFGNIDYNLSAALSKNVSLYAGCGIGDVATRGPALRLPLGITAKFDRLPVQVAYEMTPSIAITTDSAPHTRMFTDQTIAVRYVLK